MKDLLALKHLTSEEIIGIIERAVEIKRNPAAYEGALRGTNLLMLFQKTSTRTRLSFELGIQELGGRAIVMDWSKSNFSISPIRYETLYISRHVHLIMARLMKHADVAALADASPVPVINGCCEKYHPTQGLADLLTIYEKAGGFRGVTLAYIGIHNNVANSLVAGAIRVGMNLILVTPERNEASWDFALMEEAEKSGLVTITKDASALQKADFVYTDTWVDMENFDNPAYAKEKERRLRVMLPYQLRPELFGGNNPFIMHDMPVHPGLEIAQSLIESPRSIIFDQAENRLHVQKSLMLFLLGK